MPAFLRPNGIQRNSNKPTGLMLFSIQNAKVYLTEEYGSLGLRLFV